MKNLPTMQETQVQSLGQEDPLEKAMATHSSILTWRIPWTEESCGLQFVGLERIRHNRATDTHHISSFKCALSAVIEFMAPVTDFLKGALCDATVLQPPCRGGVHFTSPSSELIRASQPWPVEWGGSEAVPAPGIGLGKSGSSHSLMWNCVTSS